MSTRRRARFHPVMRIVSVIVSLALITTYIVAAPLQARAEDIKAAKAALDAANARARYSAPVSKPRRIPPPKSLKENLKPLTRAQVAQLHAKAQMGSNASGSVTLLDSIGNLKRAVPTSSEVNRTAQKLAGPAHKALGTAYSHLIHGELLLARDQQPEAAIEEFQSAERLAAGSRARRALRASSSPSLGAREDLPRTPERAAMASAIRDTANFDIGLALYYDGQYKPAADHLQSLLHVKRPLSGIARRDVALFLGHARACTGYHAIRATAGIVEPTRIAPLCGVEAIAAWLRVNGRPYSKKTVLPTCRYTGEGSNLADLEASATRLGLHHFVFGADVKGLIALPKPLVAFVEHDHFVSVVNADARGVTYLCADCGLWPGGEQHLTWKQWRLMEAGPYMALAAPGSDIDGALKIASDTAKLGTRGLAREEVPGKREEGRGKSNSSTISGITNTSTLAAGGVRLVSASGQTASQSFISRLSARLKGHVIQVVAYAQQVMCGNKPQGGESSGGGGCGGASCPMDGGGPGGGGSGTVTAQSVGPSAGDPVNLATLEELYQPDADLTVYNPIGPSVSFQRMYGSMRAFANQYNSDDLGVGWSHNYNYAVYDTTIKAVMRFAQGSSTGQLNQYGTDAPASGLNWDIVQNGTTIATSSSPNGWSVSVPYYSSVTVTIPSNAAIGNEYEVRAKYTGYGGGSFISAFFDVYASSSTPQVPQGGAYPGYFSATGSDAPGAGLTWDILQGGVTIASSAATNQWVVSNYYNEFMITSPQLAAVTSYEVRYHTSQGTNYSATFQVYAIDYNPKAGVRYLVEPNGAQVAITAYSVPTAANPTVTCVMPAGYPLLVTWNYVSGTTCGYFNITGPDRKQLITTTAAKLVGGTGSNASAMCYILAEMIDQSGNAIYFNYGAPGSGGFPMLSSIADKNGSALVTFTRTSGTGNLTAISDRYGRSVYYSVGTYASQNIPSGHPQSFQQVSTVSQIVATGTSSPPNRYTYGYYDVPNGENNEEVPFLHTITVPSPTGMGNSTATINYATNGTCYVSSIVDANGNSRNYTVTNASTTTVTVKDANNNVDYTYSVTFDSNMNETGRTNGVGVVQADKVFADPNDPYRTSEVTNANGNIWYYTWDQFGNGLSTTTPRNTVTTFTMTYTNFALGELTEVTEGGKTPTTMSYYEPSGLIQTINAPAPGTAGNGATVAYSYTYSALGNVLTETRPGNNAVSARTITFNYTSDPTYNYTQAEALRQPLTRTDELGHISRFRFDARAERVAEIDALGNETDSAWTLAGQHTSTTFAAAAMTGTGRASIAYTYLYPGGPETLETQYNESGTQFWQIAYTYGAEGETLARSGSTQPYSASFDALYRIVASTDGSNNTTHYYFKHAGYADAITYPGYSGPAPVYDAGTDSYDNITGGDAMRLTQYDALGDLLQRLDGRGVYTNYLYSEPESKLTDVQYPSSSSINVHVTYDAYSRQSTISDGTGSRANTHDDLNNKLSVDTTYTGIAGQTISYGYNPDGSRSSMSLPSATSIQYSYDAAGRTVGLTAPGNLAWSWSFLNNDWLSSQSDNNTVTVTYPRNARGFLTELTNTSVAGNSVLSDYTISSYDPTGDLGQVVSTLPGYFSLSGTTNYQRDSKLELTQEQSTRGGGSGYTNTFAYSGAGNPTTFRGAACSFNSDNQNTAFGFDGNGNPTSYNGGNLTFDAENRMAAFGSLLTAGYRGDGLRAWKQNGSGVTYYVYDGNIPVLEIDGSGSTLATNIFGPTGLLARTTPSRTLLYASDLLGNVAEQVNAATGATVASYMFDSYGARGYNSNDNAAINDPFAGFGGCSGYYTDWETGLEALSYRYYDPGAGRFLNRDPINIVGGVNLYEYVSDNPLGHSDLTGASEPSFAITPPANEDVSLGGCIAGVLTEAGTGIISDHGGLASTLCSLGVGCAAGAMCGFLSALINEPFFELGRWTGGAAAIACLIGALCGAMASILGMMCEQLEPCHEEPNVPELLCNIVADAATGCIGAVVPPIIRNWFGGGYAIGVIGAGLRALCKSAFGKSERAQVE